MEAKLKDTIISLGCQDRNTAARAALLHLHLSEELLMYNIEPHYHKDSQTVYITASKSKNSVSQIFVPHNANDNLNLERVKRIQEALMSDSINFALIDSDSTIVIYALTSGIKTLKNAEELNRSSNKNERRHFIDKELKKQKMSILTQAEQQTVIDD